MSIDKERNSILQPTSWKSVVAQLAQLPISELSSAPMPTALHAAARSFILSTYQRPSLHNTKQLSECLSTYNHRQERWQTYLAERREEEQDEFDALQDQKSSFAVQTNHILSNLALFQNKINYYTDLLPFAQRHAQATSYLWAQVPAGLPPKAQRESFSKLLKQHAVIYTPQSIVSTIRKLIRYYRLLSAFYLSVNRGDNCSVIGYTQAEKDFMFQYAPSAPSVPDGPLPEDTYTAFVECFPEPQDISEEILSIPLPEQEIHTLDAWVSLAEDFPLPRNFPQQDEDEEPSSLLAQQPADALPEGGDKSILSLPAPAPSVQSAAVPTLPKKLPKIHGKSKISSVLTFLYGLTKDIAFAQVPTTSNAVKCLLNKFQTKPMMALDKSLDSNMHIYYSVAQKRLIDYYKKLLDEECAQQTKQGLSAVATSGRAGVEDPAQGYRTQPQDAVEYMTHPTAESLPSEDEILKQIRGIEDRFLPEGVPLSVHAQEIAPLQELLRKRQVLDRHSHLK